ncbi:MAG: EamA family transporter [Gemmatimonadota bacterium]|nr:EamA family transporter [Gemmatimonadota bacterium]MDH3368165.1 EamA family transporter [Gemmatimonadota bacterium]MDH3478494.1 EamA family transporter [Gemmatimonadota bacterium]MDH3570107.1 EamA family transporter [Gemmatimonadota bacterium]MDH5548397.1 EamA family transporter [Gemmatimonadota bacterium]
MQALSGRILAAYVTISLIWGSTYLAIRIGVQHLPPALFGGIRFVVAGAILLAIARLLRRRLPTRARDWRTAAVVGILLLAIGNGLVIWAEQTVESGFAAILIVTGALWMALFDAVIPGSDTRPTAKQVTGLLAGFGGTVLLVGDSLGTLGVAALWGAVALVVASASWALGSIYSKRHPVDTPPYVHAALQMLAGGTVLALIGLLRGEAASLTLSAAGVGAVLYLIVFGSIVAFTSYVYLLRHASPTFVGTSVYVNTVVAVLLGWVVLDEHVSLRTFGAMAIILGSVVWVRRETERPSPIAAVVERV